MKTVIGIDVGGSTTKIVGFRDSQLMEPLFVRANDQLTSAYGAFGKYTAIHQMALSDIDKIMVTGVGASFLSDELYRIPIMHEVEFPCVGKGGLYLSGLDRAIIVSMGTGTALVYAENGKDSVYLGGTGVGGGTLVGLSKKMLNMDNVNHIAELARDGDLDKVDLKISDITKSDIVPGFGDIMTASNFGSVSDIATKADIALGIINMVFETIGMMSIFAARNFGIRDIVLTGNLSGVEQAPQVFGTLNKMFDMNFIIPQNSAFGTVIGAALSGIRK